MLCRVCVLPVQLERECSVDGGEAQQSNPAQQDAAEHTGLEVEDPHLEAQARRDR